MHILFGVFRDTCVFSVSLCRVGDVFEGGSGGGPKACALRKELSDLGRLEKSLDELILSSTAQLKQLTELEENKRYPFTLACLLRVVVLPSTLTPGKVFEP